MVACYCFKNSNFEANYVEMNSLDYIIPPYQKFYRTIFLYKYKIIILNCEKGGNNLLTHKT